MSVSIPRLDDKIFKELVDDARLLIPRYAPTWTDHNLHDPGITLIDLLAWLAEAQIYTLDQITDRHSEKFLRLLGFPPRPAVPASARVYCTLPNGSTQPKEIPKGTRLLGMHEGTGVDIAFETSRTLWVVPSTLIKIERSDARGRVDLTRAMQRGPYIYPFGGESEAAIEEGSALLLGFDRPFPSVNATLAIQLYTTDLPPLGTHGEEAPDVITSTAVTWEYLAEGDRWLPLPDLLDETHGLTNNGSIHFAGPLTPPPIQMSSLDKAHNLYWLRCRVARSSYDIPPRISAFYLNAVTVVEGHSVLSREVGAGSGFPSYEVTLGEPPIIEAPIIPESLTLDVQETVNGPWVRWKQVSDFDASSPEDRHFVLDTTKGTLLFGNGLRGRIVPKVTDSAGKAINNLRAAYRVSGGTQGNLEIGEINRINASGFEGITVTNPEPAIGGADPETFTAAWVRVKTDLAIPYRAVTSEDFESLALMTPGLRVARAKAIPGFDPDHPKSVSDCFVTVVVAPYSFTHCPTPSEGFLKTVCHHLDRHRLITTDLRVIGPRYVEVSVSAEVTIKPKNVPADVIARIEQTLSDFLDPLHGGAQKTGWPFGRSVYRSEVASQIEQVEGVTCTVQLRLHAKDGTVNANGDVEIPKMALICPGSFTIEAEEHKPPCKVKPCPSPAT